MALLKPKTPHTVRSLGEVYEELIQDQTPVLNGYRYVLDEIGEYGTWPRTNNALVRFDYRSTEEPYIEVEGQKQSNILSVYCQVADWTDKQIVDPADGKSKGAGHYGTPVSWVSYEVEPTELKKNKDKNIFSHTLVEGETIWDVARQYHTTAEKLIAVNDIEDPYKLPTGTVLLLPKTTKQKKRTIRYEVLKQPRQMHIIRKGGAKKWSYGNAEHWADIQESGPTYSENTNVEVLAVAHVPVGEDTAAFFLDSLSFGAYAETGRVAWETGFNWKHLADGYVQRVIREVAKRPLNEPKPTPTPKVTIKPSYKASFQPLNDERKPVQYFAKENIMVKEHDGRRPDRPMYENQGVRLFGTFVKDGVLYGRPVGSVDNGYWFGIPMESLVNEEELYSTTLDLPTRVAIHGPLSMQERALIVIARTINNKKVARIVDVFERKKEK